MAWVSPHSLSGIVSRLRAAGCVFAEDEAQLLSSAARTPAELAAMVDRRAVGIPLEHVLGWAEFCGLRIAVEPGVFVPRRRTEFLARQAIAVTRQGLAGEAPPWQETVVVDLCCGSGAVGVALAAAVGRAQLHAVDLDPIAVRCARRNAGMVDGQVYQGDLYAPLPATLRGRVGVLVANAPYVPSAEVRLLPAEARTHEPLIALDGGADGLDVTRRVIAAAPLWLAPGGNLLIETSGSQAARAAEIAAHAGLIGRIATSREPSATIMIATMPGPSAPGGRAHGQRAASSL